VGFSGSGKSTLVHCIGQLYDHTTGAIEIDGKEVTTLTKADVARNVGIVSQSPFIFDGPIEENLLYAYLSARDGGGQEPATLDDMIEAIQQAGLFVDVLRFGLNTILDHREHADLIEQILRIRENFRQSFAESLADEVEFFNPTAYLHYSSVAENVTMGAPNREDFAHEHLCSNPYFRRFLDDADLTRPLLSLGADIARQVVDILGNLEPDPSLFERSPIGPEELPDYKPLTERLKRQKLHQLSPVDQEMLLGAALRFAPALHPLVSMPPLLENLILEGRALFMERITAEDPGAVSFYEMDHYIHSQTILNNILFGKLKTDRPQTLEKINQAIIQLLVEEDLMETVVRIGLQYQVGNKGENLSGGQRQKLAIARVLLKKPPVLLMDEATSGLDNTSQSRIQHLLESRWKGTTTLISVVHRLDIIKNYDTIAVMKAGKIVEMGAYDDLMDRKGVLYELVGKS
jgi:ABC-type methionine transport system ATPase subunit